LTADELRRAHAAALQRAFELRAACGELIAVAQALHEQGLDRRADEPATRELPRYPS